MVDLGRRRYGEVLELQRTLCRRRLDGLLDQDLFLLVEHHPVVTLGRGTRAASNRGQVLVRQRRCPIYTIADQIQCTPARQGRQHRQAQRAADLSSGVQKAGRESRVMRLDLGHRDHGQRRE